MCSVILSGKGTQSSFLREPPCLYFVRTGNFSQSRKSFALRRMSLAYTILLLLPTLEGETEGTLPGSLPQRHWGWSSRLFFPLDPDTQLSFKQVIAKRNNFSGNILFAVYKFPDFPPPILLHLKLKGFFPPLVDL